MTNAWETFLRKTLSSEEHELTCQECFDLLDSYAEVLLEKGDPAELMPVVKQHLEQCGCCAGELESLLVMLQETLKEQP